MANVCKLPRGDNATILGHMDINVLIGRNLKRLREARGLSQPQLARLIGTTPQRLSSYEVGRDGMGKEYMERVCKALEAEPWEFFVKNDTPIVRDKKEQNYLALLRRAEDMGIAEKVLDYCTFEMQRTKKPAARPVPITFNEREREALRLYELAEEKGIAHLLDEFARALLEKTAAPEPEGKPRKVKGPSLHKK